MNYLVSDFIIRLKNACLAKRRKVILPYSNMNKEIGEVLKREGFLKDIKEEINEGKKSLAGELRYEKRIPVMTDVSIVSKPALRVYVKKDARARGQKRGFGVSMLSTSQGVMTGAEAKKKGIGGELLFKIW